jgi:hypothetical protein
MGTDSPIGHIDIYINSGNNQPGCAQQAIDAFHRGGILNSKTENWLIQTFAVYSFLFLYILINVPLSWVLNFLKDFVSLQVSSKIDSTNEVNHNLFLLIFLVKLLANEK